ncbi:MAG: glycosyltransferase family 2 protein [Verrucomicrobiota bacterium]
MKISTIIPCHNAGPYIQKALQSVADQTHPAHEILVIDDGSTDDSLEMIRLSGVRVRLLHVDLGSPGGTRNAGIEAATGDWVAFLDADDYWYDYHLENASRSLQGSEDTVYMCHSDAMSHDTSEVYHFSPRWSAKEQNGNTHEDFFRWFAETFYFSPSGVIQKRQTVLEAGSYDPEQTKRADVEQFMRVVHGQTWTWNATPGWRYRVDTPGGLTRDVASLEFFMLRCLLKNQGLYKGPDIKRMIALFAKRALSTAHVDGTRDDQKRARQLAWDHLDPRSRLCFRAADLAPSVFRRAIRTKRKLQGI